MTQKNIIEKKVAIIGAGPAGLMAAEVLAAHGVSVAIYDAMPSVARKFLIAGRGGLNLTHSEPKAPFLSRYGDRSDHVAPWLATFGAQEMRAWADGLGAETFVGSSGRVFPKVMKAAPLLRAWLARLQAAGVVIHTHHRWLGWKNGDALSFDTPDGGLTVQADGVLLALGGGSRSELGSDGQWQAILAEKGVAIAPLQPSNCGFNVGWSDHLRTRFAGTPLKTVELAFSGLNGTHFRRRGEFVITQFGVEGNLIYAASAEIRNAITHHGQATISLDLLPDRSLEWLVDRLSRPRRSQSSSTFLKRQLNLKGVKVGLLHEFLSRATLADPQALAAAIKALPVPLISPRPLDEAISSAGGVRFASLDEHLMLKAVPSTFCAGEMLDWEAPTGGYLLTACFASGHFAAHGLLAWLKK